MRYEGKVYRPPSEADAYILQATIGCSWNHCTYCDMYRDKSFRVRDMEETLSDIEAARTTYGENVRKVFVADGDALVMTLDQWRPILESLDSGFENLRRVSCYATAKNILEKSDAELEELRSLGLRQLYIGPESGDDVTLKRIAKGGTFAEHVEAAAKVHAAGMKISVIFLLGAGGVERSQQHAEASAKLLSEMNPEFSSALTLTIVPTTPIARLAENGRFELPPVARLLEELRIIVAGAEPKDSIFRSNHASNYLPIGGRLPRDKAKILEVIDAAIAGESPLRPEWSRGL